METELQTINDNAKSFYGKARVRQEDNRRTLVSYSTEVAYVEGNEAVVKGTFSNTTLRHIKDFLKQNGFTADTKAQIEKDYMN